MKATSKIANRYARALFEICPPQDLEKTQKGLEALAQLTVENKELQLALMNPATSLHERISVAQDVVKLVAPDLSMLNNLLESVIENKRVESMPSIAAAFTHFVEQFKRVKSLEITSAFELTEEDKNSILGEIKKDFGSDADVAWHVEPEILGGLLVQAGDLLLDGSIKSKLDQFRTNLMQ